MTAPATARARSTIYVYMTRSHVDLRDLLGRVLAAMAADARDDVAALWTGLDHGLLAHMEAEERFVLPLFALVDHEEARSLLREHGRLREQLLQLGVAVDLHCARYESSEDFAALLERHAAREERLLYRWADQRLEPSAVERVIERVSHHVEPPR